MPTRRISTLVVLFAALSLSLACGEGPRASQADLGLLQPTPDPTLDAVVRSLPRMLAGAPPTSTPTTVPTRRVPAAASPAPAKPQQKAQRPRLRTRESGDASSDGHLSLASPDAGPDSRRVPAPASLTGMPRAARQFKLTWLYSQLRWMSGTS